MATDSQSPEGAVRLYLMFVENPTSMVDQTTVTRAQAAVDKAKDPIAKLHALADLEHARRPNADKLVSDFIAQGKAYADSEGLPVSAFTALGVPRDVLSKAGFPVGGSKGAGLRRSNKGAAGTNRAPRVPLETIKRAVRQLPKHFVLTDLAEKAGGGSPATLRKAVDELISDGKVKKIGPKESYNGRGRAPTVYEVAS